MDSTKLVIYSYNSRGFSQDKQYVCNHLISISGEKLPILCNQENFLLKANLFIYLFETHESKISQSSPAQPQKCAQRSPNCLDQSWLFVCIEFSSYFKYI